MIKLTFAAALALATFAGLPARAEVLAIPGKNIDIPTSETPRKGISMAMVEKQYGAPRVRHPAAGGDTPKHPPITRWDYANFSVFFENNHVIDAVRPDAPAPVSHQDQLSSSR